MTSYRKSYVDANQTDSRDLYLCYSNREDNDLVGKNFPLFEFVQNQSGTKTIYKPEVRYIDITTKTFTE